jgi:hypothetical protein
VNDRSARTRFDTFFLRGFESGISDELVYRRGQLHRTRSGALFRTAQIAGLPIRRPTPDSGDMTPLRARVQDGRLRLDQPTELPEGTELDLVIDDEGDDLTEYERQILHETLARSWTSAQEGKVRPAAAIIEELRRKG